MRTAIEDLAGRIASPGKVALDFGCGAKPYAQLFTARGVTYIGAELGNAHDVHIRADGTLSAADQSADLVVSFQVLEHVRDIDTYLQEAGRVLRDDGLMLLSTHGTWLYHPHPEDHRRWTREGLIAELKQRRFEVTDCIAVVGPLAWTTMVRLTCIAVALRRLPLDRQQPRSCNRRRHELEGRRRGLDYARLGDEGQCLRLCDLVAAIAIGKSMTIWRTPTRFAIVGFLCAATHNAILLAADLWHIHYALSCAISYVVVVLLGFALHVRHTFRRPPDRRLVLALCLEHGRQLSGHVGSAFSHVRHSRMAGCDRSANGHGASIRRKLPCQPVGDRP